MKYTVTTQLGQWLTQQGWSVIPEALDVDTTEFEEKLVRFKDKYPAGELHDRAAFWCATPATTPKATKPKISAEVVAAQQDQILKAYSGQVELQRQYHQSHEERLTHIEGMVDSVQSVILEQDMHRRNIAYQQSNRMDQMDARQKNLADWVAANAFTQADAARILKLCGWMLAAAVLILLSAIFASAQNVNPALVVTTCGDPTITLGNRSYLTVDVNGKLCADVSGSTISVSVGTAGLATSTNQTTVGAQTTKLNDGTDTALISAAGALLVDGSATTQPVSANNLDIRDLTFANDKVDVSGSTISVSVGTAGLATSDNQTTVGSQTTKINDGTDTALVTAGGLLQVDGSGVTQPVSGTVTVTDGAGSLNVIVDSGTITGITNTVTIGTSGLATSANQTTLGSQTTKINDGTDTALVTAAGALNSDLTTIAGTAAATGSGTATGALRVELPTNGTGVISSVGTVNTVTTVTTVSTVTGVTAITGSVTPGSAAANLGKAEDATANSADVGVAILGCRNDADGTAACTSGTDGEYTVLATDNTGAVMVTGQHPTQWTYHENSSNALTDTTVHASCGTGMYNYIGTLTFSTGAATAASILIEDSTTTTILGPYYLEAVSGRGMSLNFNPPKKQTNSATLISVTTTGAIAHGLDIQGFCAP